MPFIPNSGDATYQDLAEPDSIDFEILLRGLDGTGVISGCAVTAGASGLSVAVASGTATLAGAPLSVSSATITLSPANASNPRFDLVYVGSNGTPVALTGTASTNPVFPSSSGVLPANSVPLAVVYVPAAATSVTTAMIVQKSFTPAVGRGTFTAAGQLLSSSGPSTPVAVPAAGSNGLYLTSSTSGTGGVTWSALPSGETPATRVAVQGTLASSTSAVFLSVPTPARPLHMNLKFSLRTVLVSSGALLPADVLLTPLFATGAKVLGVLTSAVTTTTGTTFTVTESSAPSANSGIYILINGELMLLGNRVASGSNWTYTITTRGALGSTAVGNHVANSVVVYYPQGTNIQVDGRFTGQWIDASGSTATASTLAVATSQPSAVISRGAYITTTYQNFSQTTGEACIAFHTAATPYTAQVHSNFSAVTLAAASPFAPTIRRSGHVSTVLTNVVATTPASMITNLQGFVLTTASTLTTGQATGFGAGSSYVLEYSTAPTT